MDFSKKKARLSFEPLEARDVPAQLGLVALPYPAAPAAEVALTAPHDLGQGEDANALKVQVQDFHFTQTVSKASPKLFSSSDSADALKVQMQDFHFTQTVNKASPKLFSSSDDVSALKVQFQDFHFTRTVSKHTPTLNLQPDHGEEASASSDAASALIVHSRDIQLMKVKLTDVLV